jgi:hypothetical protein
MSFRMPEDKIKEVINFPRPRTQKQLKQLLGLINYFHIFINRLSPDLKPLQQLLQNYKRTSIISWTAEAERQLNLVKDKIFKTPKLYFLNDTDPVFLYTDASEIGIGSYLCQRTKKHGEHPVEFYSKTLNHQEIKWTVFEKEAYAIYMSMKRWDYMLIGRPFTLVTDHRNLTFIGKDTSKKVLHWRLSIQEYMFDVEHISGDKNVVADFMSRYPQEHELYEKEIRGKETEIQSLNVLWESNHDHRDSEIIDDYQILCVISDEYQYDDKQRAIIASVHNSFEGHLGVDKNCKRIRELKDKDGNPLYLNWENMRFHVRKFINKCPVCQKLSEIKPIIHSLPFFTSELEPMSVINIDHMGPFRETDEGFQHILVIVDCFSRFVDLIPARTVTAEETAKLLLQHIGRFGTPRAIRHDRGTAFHNDTVTVMKRMMGPIPTELTIVEVKETNAMVERRNKEVLRHLRAFCLERNMRDNWDEYLPFVMRILNGTEVESLGIAPARLLFGKNINLDPLIFHADSFDESRLRKSEKVGRWMDKMLSYQSKILDIARRQQIITTGKYQEGRQPFSITSFEVNSYVLVQYPRTAMGRRPPTKLHSPWEGPMRVVSRVGTEYILENLVTKEYERHHVSSLKQFIYDPRTTDPAQVAATDRQEWEVDRVVEHRSIDVNISSYEFRIRWKNCDESQDSWLPWREVRCLKQLHDYLRANRMAHRIPKTCI